MKVAKSAILIVIIALNFFSDSFSQTDRSWWNSLSPAWKKVIQKQQFKGKDVNPSDENLYKISEMPFLDISGAKDVKTLKPVSQMRVLEVLKCNNSGVESLEGVEHLTNLKVLDCSDNDNINSLIPVAGLHSLEKLNCGNTMVKNLVPLRNLIKLTELDLHYTTIVNLRILKTLRSLEKLDVSDNISLYTLDGVEYLRELRELNCNKTNVDDLTPISKLPKLERLDCSETKVYSLRPVQLVKSLQDIDCSDTEIPGKSLDYLLGHTVLMMVRSKNIDISDKDLKMFEGLLQKRNKDATVLITKK